MNAALGPDSVGRAELVFALGAGLILVSGLLPWIAASEAIPVADPAEEADGLGAFDGDSTSESILGIDRVDWVVLAGIGLVATALVVTEPWSRVVLAVAGASGAAAVSLGAIYLVDPAWMYSDWIKSEIAAVAGAGPGVYLAIGGGILQCAGCYLGYSSSESTTGAQRLGATAQPGDRPAQREQPQPPGPDTPRQEPPAGRQPPQGEKPNQTRTGPRGRPQQRGPPRGRQPENARSSDGQRPPQSENRQPTDTPSGPVGQPRDGSAESERPPTDDEPRQPPSRGQPNSEQPSAGAPSADRPADETESADPTAGDPQQGPGSGRRRDQPRDSSEETTEGGTSSDDTDRQKE